MTIHIKQVSEEEKIEVRNIRKEFEEGVLGELAFDPGDLSTWSF